MNKSKIIETETKKLLSGIEQIENRFKLLKQKPLDTLADEPQFFFNRSANCAPLVINCTLALAALPASTPPACKIERKQYENVRTNLKSLISDFGNLQLNVNTVLNPATEAVTKTSQLLIITQKIPGVITDFASMKLECEKIKKAMDL